MNAAVSPATVSEKSIEKKIFEASFRYVILILRFSIRRSVDQYIGLLKTFKRKRNAQGLTKKVVTTKLNVVLVCVSYRII